MRRYYFTGEKYMETEPTNNLVRTTISVRARDELWLKNQQKEISSIIGINVGLSFVVRMMIRYFIAHKINLNDYRTFADKNEIN